MRDKKDIEEFKRNGYTTEEIEEMSNDKFVHIAICLVDGMSKSDIDKSLGK